MYINVYILDNRIFY